MGSGRIARVAAAGIIAAVAFGGTASGAGGLDATKLTVRPDGAKAKISAVKAKRGAIDIVLAVKKGDRYRTLDTDRAPGVKAGDGRVRIEANQDGESYEKNGGEGLLSVGDEFSKYFGWNVHKEKIHFYG